MFKKIGFILTGLTVNVWAAAGFDAESQTFSKRSTLETWVAAKSLADAEKMCKVQFYVAGELPENPVSRTFVQQIPPNEGDDRYFGKSYWALEAIQLQFLQFVHETSKTKKPIVLEIAAGLGLVSWKIPLAFEDAGTVYTNELSSKMFEPFHSVLQRRLAPEEREMIQTIPGDCFDILSSHPELAGKVDAIYVQNLEHFFNPEQHQKFIRLLQTLLTGSGRAFLSAHTLLPDRATKGNPIYDLYLKQKNAGVMYPGFMQYTYEGFAFAESPFTVIGEDKILEATRPDDSTPCHTKTLSSIEFPPMQTPVGLKKIQQLKQIVIGHFLTPTIYKNAIAPHEHLESIDGFFMDNYGHRQEKFGEGSCFAAAIIRKK